jgi:hypothetical protein
MSQYFPSAIQNNFDNSDCNTDIMPVSSLIQDGARDSVRRLNWSVPLRDLFPSLDAILNISHIRIRSIGLSVRSVNCLDAAGIKTVGELLNHNIEYLIAIPKMGVGSVWNIMERLQYVMAGRPEDRITDLPGSRPENRKAARESLVRDGADAHTGGAKLLSSLDPNQTLGNMLLGKNYDLEGISASIRELKLPARAVHCFEKYNVSNITQVLDFTIRELLAMRWMGIATVCDILISLRAWIPGRSSAPDEPEEPSAVSAIQDPLDDLSTPAATLIFDLAVSALTNPDRKSLRSLKITSLPPLIDLCSARRAEQPLTNRIAPLLAAARESLRAWSNQDDLGELQSIYFPLIYQCDFYTDTRVSADSTWLRNRISSILSGRPVLARSYFERMNGGTLIEVGRLLGVTGDYAYQAIRRAEYALGGHPGFVGQAVDYVCGIVQRFGGCLGRTELENILWWSAKGDSLPHRDYIVSYFSDRPEWKESGLVTTEAHVIIESQWKKVSSILRRVGTAVAKREAYERQGPHYWSAPLSRVLIEAANIINDELYDSHTRISVSTQALALAMIDQDVVLESERDHVYSSASWNLLYGSACHQLEDILKIAGRPMHHTEILGQFRRRARCGSSSARRVDGALERSPDILLWDRGIYIHRSLVTVPQALVKRIAAWIDSRLATGVPFFSVARAFDEFRSECVASGIPSRQALYSMFRLAFSGTYRLHEYPYIAIQSSGDTRPPVHLLIEEYVRIEGGYVTRQSVTSYVSDELGVNSRLVPHYLALTPNVLSAHRRIIHADNITVNDIAVHGLVQAAISGLVRNKQLNIGELLKSTSDLIARLGITDMRLIHSLILSRSGGRLFGRYPNFASQYASAKLTGIADLVATYISERNAPCSFKEIRSHFVDERGINERSVHWVTNHEHIVKYSPHALIHLDTMAWDIGKQTFLDEAAGREYDMAVQRGQIFATTHDLLRHWETCLPSIGEFAWTETLASQLLRRTPKWLFVGNAKNAYLAGNNVHGIRSLDDLVTAHLTRYCSGTARLEDIEEYLRANGIIQRRLTQFMLGENAATVIVGNDILLRRLRYAEST